MNIGWLGAGTMGAGARNAIAAMATARTAQARPPEILRLLKRYLARELFPLLKADLHHAHQLNKT